MLHTVHFNYLNILKFSMIVEANSHEEALKIVESTITDNKVFAFSQNAAIKLGYIQTADIRSYFSMDRPKSISQYSIMFEDEDDIPTRPDMPNMLKKKD